MWKGKITIDAAHIPFPIKDKDNNGRYEEKVKKEIS